MGCGDDMVNRRRPDALSEVVLPPEADYHPSPADWRDEVLYFLMVDRFSDGKEGGRPLLDRRQPGSARAMPGGRPWSWQDWARSGHEHWQGGTLCGVQSKLPYLRDLGVTTLWLSPVFKQRGHLDSYHGYGVADFLDVDPRLGSRQDLVDLVKAAHSEGIRVLLDIIFNHSGANWVYPEGTPGGSLEPHYTQGRYDFGNWRDRNGKRVGAIATPDDGVWPRELQDPDRYTRAGVGSLSAGRIDDDFAEHKRTDFFALRDFRLEAPGLLTDLAACYKYWIALTDCDGFRIDTLKHVSLEQARNFCGSIKEFAVRLGKLNFFLVGEVAGGDQFQATYLDVLERNLDAALDIGEVKLALRDAAKGYDPHRQFFGGFERTGVMGSHRQWGKRHVSILDDHDHVFGSKLRFSVGAASDHQVVAGVALQFLTLGIPCLYYGTEQALSGPEASEQPWLPNWGRDDRYLREAMFGPLHPLAKGLRGLAGERDADLPGFGAFGTVGHHCFDPDHPACRRIAALAKLRREHKALRHGRQYPRQTSVLGGSFVFPSGGEIIAWSRILDDVEVLCVLNAHGTEPRGADVIVDAGLSAGPMTVLLATAEAGGAATRYRKGMGLETRLSGDGRFAEIRDLAPSEVLVLSNRGA